MGILGKLGKRKKLAPIYVLILEEDREPTESDLMDAMEFFIRAGKLESPSLNARFAYLYDVDMSRGGEVSGEFMITIGRELLEWFPDLEQYITISQGEFRSNNLAINIVGTETETGYVRVVHIKEM